MATVNDPIYVHVIFFFLKKRQIMNPQQTRQPVLWVVGFMGF